MKRFLKVVSIAAISTLAASSMAFAQSTHTVKLTVDCPDICNKSNECLIADLNNNTVAGLGLERVNSDVATRPNFMGSFTAGSNVPADLAANGYSQLGTSYNASNGMVVCYYTSSMGFDPISASYQLTNATGGVVTSSGPDEIKIKIQTGFTK